MPTMVEGGREAGSGGRSHQHNNNNGAATVGCVACAVSLVSIFPLLATRISVNSVDLCPAAPYTFQFQFCFSASEMAVGDGVR